MDGRAPSQASERTVDSFVWMGSLPSLFIKKRRNRALWRGVEKKVTEEVSRVGIIDEWLSRPTDHRASLCNSV